MREHIVFGLLPVFLLGLLVTAAVAQDDTAKRAFDGYMVSYGLKEMSVQTANAGDGIRITERQMDRNRLRTGDCSIPGISDNPPINNRNRFMDGTGNGRNENYGVGQGNRNYGNFNGAGDMNRNRYQNRNNSNGQGYRNNNGRGWNDDVAPRLNDRNYFNRGGYHGHGNGSGNRGYGNRNSGNGFGNQGNGDGFGRSGNNGNRNGGNRGNGQGYGRR